MIALMLMYASLSIFIHSLDGRYLESTYASKIYTFVSQPNNKVSNF